MGELALAAAVSFGVSFLKLVTNDYIMTGTEWGILAVGAVVAYIVSMLSVKFLMNYVKQNDFKLFGWYRIVLGLIVIGFFIVFR